jgi:phosphoglycerate-specific signal transduction histidine kinase
MLHRLPVGPRLLVAFLACALLTVLLGISAWVRSYTVQAQLDEVFSQRLVPVTQLAQSQRAALMLQRAQVELVAPASARPWARRSPASAVSCRSR